MIPIGAYSVDFAFYSRSCQADTPMCRTWKERSKIKSQTYCSRDASCLCTSKFPRVTFNKNTAQYKSNAAEK